MIDLTPEKILELEKIKALRQRNIEKTVDPATWTVKLSSNCTVTPLRRCGNGRNDRKRRER